MIVAPGGDVHGAENFFVLNIGAGHGQNLSSEAEFADGAGGGIGFEECESMIDCGFIATKKGGVLDMATIDLHESQGAILFEPGWELSAGAAGDPIDFAGGEIGDFAGSAAEAMAFLGF